MIHALWKSICWIVTLAVLLLVAAGVLDAGCQRSAAGLLGDIVVVQER